MTAHTPTPWETSSNASNEWDVCAEGGGDMIADLAKCDNGQANAEFIVQACNGYEPTRDALLALIMSAPDPGGFEKVLPHYWPRWSAARELLRQTCPNHIQDGSGTCPSCHGDTGEFLPSDIEIAARNKAKE